jgi:hypothetical protein
MTVPTDTDDIVSVIRARHRKRQYALRIQQQVDRALESFVRRNYTEWALDLSEAERAKINREVQRLIASARKGEGDAEIINLVGPTDKSREPWDTIREAREKEMKHLARRLPVWPWVEAIRGAGDLGLATIVAETGSLSNYANPAKVWKRLGFAPYDGRAGSTWKRESWRDRTLTKEEWIANPYSGKRYAMMYQIALWLRNAQWIGADKTEDGEGKPNGSYGEVYAARRAHTALTHPDWSKMHSDKDALRYMFKRFVRNLWSAWRAAEKEKGEAMSGLSPDKPLPPLADEAMADLKPTDRMPRRHKSEKGRAIGKMSPNKRLLAPADEARPHVNPTEQVSRRRKSEKGEATSTMSPTSQLPAPTDEATKRLKPKPEVPRRHKSEKGQAIGDVSSNGPVLAPPADAAKSALKPKRSVPRRKNRAPPANDRMSPSHAMPGARDDFSF